MRAGRSTWKELLLSRSWDSVVRDSLERVSGNENGREDILTRKRTNKGKEVGSRRAEIERRERKEEISLRSRAETEWHWKEIKQRRERTLWT